MLELLDPDLRALLAHGRAAWPGLKVEEDLFGQQIARGLGDTNVSNVLDQLHISDLYLACACLLGDTRAHAALDVHFLTPLADRLSARNGSVVADEIVQEVRTRLLLAHGQSIPRLARYHGRGALAKWLRVAAARIAVDLVRAHPVGDEEDIDRTPLPSPIDDPEMALVAHRMRADFESAFRETLALLAARDASVLRLHYLQGATVTDIAKRRGVTRRSVQHWLARARTNVIERLRAILALRFPNEDAPLDELAQLARGPVDLNLNEMLLECADGPDVRGGDRHDQHDRHDRHDQDDWLNRPCGGA